MALTDTAVKNFKPSDKATGEKHSDGQGLYLHVKPAGKYWRMSYRFAGKQKLLSLGVYPAVSLAKARQRRDKARELLAEGIDPAQPNEQKNWQQPLQRQTPSKQWRVNSTPLTPVGGVPGMQPGGSSAWRRTCSRTSAR